MKLDDEDVRSYRQRAYFEKEEKKDVNPFSIFFAVLAAILVAWFIRQAYFEWQLRQIAHAFNQEMQVINDRNQEQIRLIQQKSAAMRAQAEEEIRIKAEETRRQRVLAHQIELDKQAALEKEIDARSRKDAAWEAFYKPIRGCEKDNPDRDAIKCGNDYIRARNRFEHSWNSAPQ